MNEPVLDSSAVLAVILQEPGEQNVRGHLLGAFLSSVNFAEVVARLRDRGMSGEETRQNVLSLGIVIVPFYEDQALLAGELREPTKTFGLSLGDRACLALASLRRSKAFTADSAWKRVQGFDIELIRDGKRKGQP